MTASPTEPELLAVDDLTTMELPERWELIEGVLIDRPFSSAWAGRLGASLASTLLVDFERTGQGWAFGFDTAFILGSDRRTVVAPSTAFVRRDRLKNPDTDGYVETAPDFAIEVLSPSDRYSRVLYKAVLYLEAGSSLVWLVDPKQLNVCVLTPDDPPQTFSGDVELTAAPVLPDWRITVSGLFASPTPVTRAR